MALRTTDAAVRRVMKLASDTETSEAISAANALTDKVSNNDQDSVLNSTLLTSIETYLAAHFLAPFDKQWQQEKNLDAAGRVYGEFDETVFGETPWGKRAMALDVSGYLRSINNGAVTAGVHWLGLPPSEQTDYIDRD